MSGSSDAALTTTGPGEAALLADVIDALPVGIALFDAAGALRRFNRAFAALNPALSDLLRPGLGWALLLREWQGRGVLSRREHDRLAAMESALGEDRDAGPLEVGGSGARGFEMALHPARDGGFVLVQTDTAPRRRSEESQREAEDLLRNVLGACPANVVMSRVADGQILYRSPAATELLGTARSTQDHFARREERADFITALLPQGRVDDMPVTGVRPDGTRFPCLISARLIDYRGDDVIVSSTIDISKEIALRRTLAEQREQIFQAEKTSALGELLAGVAHELNNPLSVVVGHALMMREDTADPEVLRRIDKIGAAAERCSRIVKSFLAMARQQPVRLQPTDLAECARAVIDALANGPEGMSATVEVDIPAAVPPIQGDAHQITQVILNLLSNADQAIRDSGASGRIRVLAAADPGGGTVTLTVADDGPGIAEAIRGRIFDPLFSTKEVGRGTGIGLAFCHRIVAAHAGRIRFEPGDPGARFHVTLPVAGAAEDAEVATPDATARAVATILVVDDESDVADLIREILARDGFVVREAGSGEAALDLLRRESFDLILTDVNMPGMGGRGFYDTLLRRDPAQAARVGFVTGDTMSPQVRSFLDAAGWPTLEKPIAPAELRRLVRSMRTQSPGESADG